MLIGKAGPARTSICTASADGIEVRGRDLCGDLMGRLGFTEFFYLLVTGREPTDRQRFFLDLLLLSIAEHGLTPTTQAARMTLDADPASLQGAVAAGILGCGTVVLGSAEDCGQFLTSAAERIGQSRDARAVLEAMLTELRANRGKVPGFGHPIHHPVDPRTARILSLADEHHIDGRHLPIARLMPQAVEKIWGRPMPMNVSMAIAAVLLDLDFPATMIKAIPILARTAGILGHLAEEQAQPIGFLMASKGEEAIAYERDGEGDPR